MGLYIEKIGEDQFKLIDSRYIGAWKMNFSLLSIYIGFLASGSNDPAKIKDILNKFGNSFPISHIKKGIDYITESRFPLHALLDPHTVYRNALKEKKGVISPPEVALEVTDRCPYSCRWCFVNVSLRKKVLSSTCSVPLKILDNHLIEPIIEMGGLLWSLTGGEPSICPERTMNLARLISTKTKSQLGRTPTIGLITNGWNLEKLAPHYKKAGITTVQIALPTLDEKRDAHYRGPPENTNSVQIAIKGAQRALELGLEVGFNCVIFPTFKECESNMKDIPSLIQKACELELTYIRLTPVVPPEKSLLDGRVGIAFTRQLMDAVEQVKEQLPDDRTTIVINGVLPGEEFVSKGAQSVHDYSPGGNPQYLPGAVFCQAGTTFVYIDAQGHAAPCNHVMPDFVEDHTLLDVPIDHIWKNSLIFQQFREIVPSCHECVQCIHRIECTGNCRAMLWRRSRVLDLSKKPDNCPKDVVST